MKLSLDLAIGETSEIESADKGKIEDIVKKVKDLNARLNDIRREQVFQRVSKSQFALSPGGVDCSICGYLPYIPAIGLHVSTTVNLN